MSDDVLDDLFDLPETWIAHDRPERVFCRGMWLCDCAACVIALRAEVEIRPRTPFVLTTESDRIVVTADLLLEALDGGGGAEVLCYVADDHVREVFVANPPGLTPPARWWSMTCDDDELLVGRRVAARRRPTRRRPRALA